MQEDVQEKNKITEDFIKHIITNINKEDQDGINKLLENLLDFEQVDFEWILRQTAKSKLDIFKHILANRDKLMKLSGAMIAELLNEIVISENLEHTMAILNDDKLFAKIPDETKKWTLIFSLTRKKLPIIQALIKKNFHIYIDEKNKQYATDLAKETGFKEVIDAIS